MNCSKCGRDLDEIFQDNMSPVPGCPVCEDCAKDMSRKDWNELKEIEDEVEIQIEIKQDRR